MKKKPQRIITVCLLVSFLLSALAACGKAEEPEEYQLAEEDKLIVYTSHKEEIYGPIIREFEERTGIWVEVVSGGTNEILEQVAEENGKDSGDIMFGGGVDSLKAYQDYFEPYRCAQYEMLDDSYASPDDSYTVFSRLPIVIIYNKKLVFQAGRPRSFQELLEPRWKGKIAFAAPDKSGSSYTALLTMMQVLEDKMPKEEVFERFVENLDGNISPGSGEVLDEVISGKRLVGLTLEETALKRMAKNADIGIIYPSEGTTAVPDGCAILKNAPHQENAKLFLEFTVSEDVQRLLEDQLYRRSVRKGQETEETGEVLYDLSYSELNRDAILEKWAVLTGEKEAGEP